ncbi:MAG TPA: methyltransferase [Magnetospirillaceae bacterium]|jgi:predicted methyltransferase
MIATLRNTILSVLFLAGAVAPALADDDPTAALKTAIDGPARTPANKARDAARHPLQELTFFGLRPDMTVVEIWPGGGWWTEILAPYLKDHGTYYVAQVDRNKLGAGGIKGYDAFTAKLKADPAVYGKVNVTTLWGDKFAIAPANSVDLIVTFRNLHNWMEQGTADETLNTFYKALKPGGMLGIDDHRGRTDKHQDPTAADGYVRQDYAIALAEKAGFQWVGSSEMNANPRDTKDYPAGVWTLPPTLRLGDKDKEKYLAIGESDVFTLLFMKPY